MIVTPGDFNPSRVLLDDTLTSTPQMDVADLLPGATIGVLDYSFSNFKLFVTEVPPVTDGGLAAEVFPSGAEAGLPIMVPDNVENLGGRTPTASTTRRPRSSTIWGHQTAKIQEIRTTTVHQ